MIYTAIDSFYLTYEQLLNSPSRKDDVDEKTEVTLRVYGCELIQEAGILLRLPQAVMATGQVLFQRFFCKKSFARFNCKRVAASCLWLAAKLEENPKKIRDVVNVFNRIDQRRQGLSLEPLEPLSKQYEEMKTDLIRTERHLLKEMGFVCHVEHPHKFILFYLEMLDLGDSNVKQEAWNLANDSLRTTLCVRFRSEVVACGVIYAAARRARIPLPENPPWWLAFDAEKSDLDEVCYVLAELYQQPKPRYVEVGKDTKSFVLSTRAWEPPSDLPVIGDTTKTAANGHHAPPQPAADGPGGAPQPEKDTAPQGGKETEEPAKDGASFEPKRDPFTAATEIIEEEMTKTSLAPERDVEEVAGTVQGQSKEIEKGPKEKESREKGRAGDTEQQRDGDREHGRSREQRDKERSKDREHRDRDRDRPRDVGRYDKRHHSSSRDRDRDGSSHSMRGKERNLRYHPYDRSNRS